MDKTRYIYIFEDGEIQKGSTFSENDKISVDDGILDVIDISGDEPKTWYKGEWHDIEAFD